jgi:DNA polymerase-3 subunit alpha
MMFATLDDLEAAVEVIVFGKALQANEETLVTDSIVQIRGRVDHKDRDKTCIIAQQVERFEATAAEVEEAKEQAAKLALAPSALRLRLDATTLASSVLGELKEVLGGYPGDSDVVIELSTSIGQRRLKLGQEFRVSQTAGLHAELHALLGHAMLSDPASAAGPDVAAPGAARVEHSDQAAVTAVS